MLIALDSITNYRISASSGKEAICPVCKGIVKAYCGDIMVHHWKHKITPLNCDTWKENETKWHRDWKLFFPFDWREVTIGEHRADIKTKSGLVLELQNSPISVSDIMKRERFYGNMVWLINAQQFSQNISMRSMVSYHLISLKSSYEYDKRQPQLENQNLVNTRKNLDLIIDSLNRYGYKESDLNYKIRDVKELLSNLEDIVQEYVDSHYYCFTFLKNFNSNLKDDILNFDSLISNSLIEIENLKNDINKNLERLNYINSLRSCSVENYEMYKHITPEQVKKESYKKCALIDKSTINLLFATEVIKLNSGINFENVIRFESFDLIINLEEDKKELLNDIELWKIKIDSLIKANDKKTQLRTNAFNQLKSEISVYLNELIESYFSEIAENENNVQNLKDEEVSEIQNIDSLLMKAKEQKEIEDKILEKKYNNDRFEVMKEYKGEYTYQWKHRRKAWNSSVKRKFFDFGEFIFEIIDDGNLKKMTKSEFINLIKTT